MCVVAVFVLVVGFLAHCGLFVGCVWLFVVVERVRIVLFVVCFVFVD